MDEARFRKERELEQNMRREDQSWDKATAAKLPPTSFFFPVQGERERERLPFDLFCIFTRLRPRAPRRDSASREEGAFFSKKIERERDRLDDEADTTPDVDFLGADSLSAASRLSRVSHRPV